jgi:hypothetical protein
MSREWHIKHDRKFRTTLRAIIRTWRGKRRFHFPLIEKIADARHRHDDHNRNAGGDQAVFDWRYAILVAEEVA